MLTRRHLMTFVMGLFVALSIGASCETIHPPQGPNTAYPCGIWGVECPGQETCCPYNHECGFDGPFSTCHAGYCCYTGDDWPRAGTSVDGGRERGTVKAKPWSSR